MRHTTKTHPNFPHPEAQVIAEHFYREGRFQLGDAFVEEARVAGADAIKAPYVSLHGVLQQVGAAFAWTSPTCSGLA
jgi:hypothetical protein